MSVTHITAPAFRMFDKDGKPGRVIQRCMVCGEKLLDNLNTSTPVKPDGTTDEFPSWPAGELVRWSGSQPRHEELLPDDEGRMPKDICLNLVE